MGAGRFNPWNSSTKIRDGNHGGLTIRICDADMGGKSGIFPPKDEGDHLISMAIYLGKNPLGGQD